MSSHHRSTHRSSERTIAPVRKGQRAIAFKEGGLHQSLGVASGKKLTAAQHEAARHSSNPKTRKQELFFENVLKGRGR